MCYVAACPVDVEDGMKDDHADEMLYCVDAVSRVMPLARSAQRRTHWRIHKICASDSKVSLTLSAFCPAGESTYTVQQTSQTLLCAVGFCALGA